MTKKIAFFLSVASLGFYGPSFAADQEPIFAIGAELDDVSTKAPTENGFSHLRITPTRKLMVDATISPFSDNVGSGSLTALNTTVVASTQGMGTVVFNVTGTWVGTVRIEGTNDSGTTWILMNATDGSQSIFATFTANTAAYVNSAGFSQVRLKMSAYTSGTATVTWNAGVATQFQQIWNTNVASMQARVEGRAANAVTDFGNPLKTGAKFNSTVPTYTDGQRADSQANRNGALNIQFRNTAARITGNTTSTVKSGAGILHSVVIGANAVTGIITIYDNTAGSGTVLFQFDTGKPSTGLSGASDPGPFSTGPLGLEFATGLTVVTTGSASNDVTIVYQ